MSLIKIILMGLLNHKKNRVLFLGNYGRHSNIDGKIYDLYNARIIEQKGRDDFIIMEAYRDGVVDQYQAEFYYKEDLRLLILFLRFLFQIFNNRDLQTYAENILDLYPELSFSVREVRKIASHFYATFIASKMFLWFIKPSRVLLICHYGHEPFIAACKHFQLPVIELMHGSISDSHPHYNYPPSYSSLFINTMFPDKLAVYGEFWKDNVVRGNMFPEDAVEIVGYYLKVPDVQKQAQPAEKNVILITSQWTVVDVLYDYVKFLKENLNKTQWQVIIKPHPAERLTTYQDLLEEDFVLLSNENIYKLLQNAGIHISVCSSVLWEAIRYDVANYVLLDDRYQDESHALINSGVALPLGSRQIPDPAAKPDVPPDYFFADFNPSVLFD
ncbi:MAG: hypothetical protein WBB69_05710 [Anaerolineales bacterium]